MNDGTISTVERALEIARGESCSSVADVRRSLRQEGYPATDENTAGTSTQTRLRAVIKDLRA